MQNQTNHLIIITMQNQSKTSHLDAILSFIDRQSIELRIDDTPSRDKIERIKHSIRRKNQLFNTEINKYTKKTSPQNV